VSSPGPIPSPFSTPEFDFSVAALADGTADRSLRLFAARGLLPLGIEDRLRTLLAVAHDADPEIAGFARETLARVTPDEWGLLIDLAALSPREIETLSEASSDPGVLEPIVRHPETSDAVLIRLAREGYNCSFAVDGPRGPIYKLKPGVLEASRLLDCPIYYASVSCDRAFHLHRAWNRAYLPKPFARIHVQWYGPIGAIERDHDPRDPRVVARLEQLMVQAKREARVPGQEALL